VEQGRRDRRSGEEEQRGEEGAHGVGTRAQTQVLHASCEDFSGHLLSDSWVGMSIVVSGLRWH
jgi:hypothetical protein